MALLLFKDRFTKAYDEIGFYTYDDFVEFARSLDMMETRAIKILDEFNGKDPAIDKLIDASFLRDDVKEFYRQTYKGKATRLRIFYSKSNQVPTSSL